MEEHAKLQVPHLALISSHESFQPLQAPSMAQRERNLHESGYVLKHVLLGGLNTKP